MAWVFVRNDATGLKRALNRSTCLAIMSFAVSRKSVSIVISGVFPIPTSFLPFSVANWVHFGWAVTNVLVDGYAARDSIFLFEFVFSVCGRRSMLLWDWVGIGVVSFCTACARVAGGFVCAFTGPSDLR